MSIALNDNLDINAPKLIDDRSKRPDGQAYTSKAEVLTLLPVSKRTIGLPVLIGNDYYYFKTGINNESDLHIWTQNIPNNIVETVTGNIVDNTDSKNPVVNFNPLNYPLTVFPNTGSNPYIKLSDISGKVDKIPGMGLSQESFTTNEKSKLSTIELNAQENRIEKVYVDGIELPINNKSVFISLPQSDRILTVGSISTSTNILTLGVGFSWILSSVQYQNTTEYNEVIPYTSDVNMKRVDIIVANQFNTFQRIEGVESATLPTRPVPPPNTIIITTVDVFHDSIGNPSTPTNDEFLPIEGEKWYNTNVLTDVLIPASTNISNFRIIGLPDSTLELRGFIVDAEQTDGLVVKVWNDSDKSIKAIDSFTVGVNEVNIEFPNGEDMTIEPKEVYTFKLYKPNAVNLTGAKFLLVSINTASADAELEFDVFSDVDTGAIIAGETIAKGTTFTEFVQKLLNKTFYPTFTPYSISGNAGSAVEVGTGTKTVTITFNRGNIVGDLDSGVWNPALVQGQVLGAANKYWINGIDNGISNSLNIYKLTTLGSNSVPIAVDYDAGAQPKDSKGNNYLTPEPAGTLNGTATWQGFYYRTAIAGNSAPTASDIRTNYTVRRSNAGVINMPTGTTNVRFDVFVPQGSTLTSAIDEGNLNLDITSEFVLQGSDFSGLDANYDEVLYKHYVRIVDNPYTVSSNIAITVT